MERKEKISQAENESVSIGAARTLVVKFVVPGFKCAFLFEPIPNCRKSVKTNSDDSVLHKMTQLGSKRSDIQHLSRHRREAMGELCTLGPAPRL